jgi:hypothetical protein
MRNAVVTAAATLLLASTAASAQPAMTGPLEPPAPIEAKRASTATALAIGATLGGLALASSGAEHNDSSVVFGGLALMMLGPSAGHFYAGETSHGVKMSLLRTGGLLILGVGLITSNTAVDCAAIEGEVSNCSTRDSHANGEKMMWIGGATLVGATLYDLWDAHNVADRANEKAVRMWTVAPSIMAGASGGTVPALTVGGSF